jgi:predicted transcriptional regulator
LEGLTEERAPGPAHSFAAVHVFKALELIRRKLIGRSKLSKELALGEGATRTLIERLKDKGLVTVERAGCTLTEKGEEFWEAFQEAFPRKTILEKSKLTVGLFNVALLVKGGAGKVKSGMEQRDAALMAGAKGATTLICRDSRLIVPPEQRDVAKDFPKIHKALMELLLPGENDAIVIGSADKLEKAEYGSLAAALSLINGFDGK